MPEVRFEAKESTIAVLDGYCSATGKCRTAFINQLLEDWAMQKLHEAIAVAVHRAGAFVHMFELMAANHQALVELGIPGAIVTKADFLLASPNPVYDRVMMNPPFAKQADIRHVLHALKFLRPDGLLVSVMSAGVTFRDNRLTQDFRDLVRSRGGDIEALPDGAFKASGTMVNTVIVTIPGIEKR